MTKCVCPDASEKLREKCEALEKLFDDERNLSDRLARTIHAMKLAVEFDAPTLGKSDAIEYAQGAEEHYKRVRGITAPS